MKPTRFLHLLMLLLPAFTYTMNKEQKEPINETLVQHQQPKKSQNKRSDYGYFVEKPLPTAPKNNKLLELQSGIAYDEKYDDSYNPPFASRVFNWYQGSDKRIEINHNYFDANNKVTDEKATKTLYFIRHFMEAIKDAKEKNDQEFLEKIPARILNNQIIAKTHQDLVSALHAIAKERKQVNITESLINALTTRHKVYGNEWEKTDQQYQQQITEQQEILANTIKQINELIASLQSRRQQHLEQITKKTELDLKATFKTSCKTIQDWATIQDVTHLIGKEKGFPIANEEDNKVYDAESLKSLTNPEICDFLNLPDEKK